MAGPVSDTHRMIYADNIKLALSVDTSDKFNAHFSWLPNVSGKQAQVIDILGEMTARSDAPDGGPTPKMTTTHEPVWVQPKPLDIGFELSMEDKIKALTDYKSPYVQTAAKAMVKGKNERLAAAIFGPRLIGNDAPTSTAWAGDSVAKTVGSSDGATNTIMNVKKVLRAIRYMEEAGVDHESEQMVLFLSSRACEELYYDVTFVSKDYRDRAVLEQRMVREIMGIPIVSTQLLGTADSGATGIGALACKSALHWGEALPLSVKSAESPDRRFRETVYLEQWLAATRSEDKKVVKILNHLS